MSLVAGKQIILEVTPRAIVWSGPEQHFAVYYLDTAKTLSLAFVRG
jgi:hypothetical protein